MKKILVLLAVSLFVLVSGAFALERDTIQNYMNQVQSLQSEISGEQRVQQDLLKTKDLILEGDKTNKEETAKLRQDVANFQANVNAYKADRSALDEEEKRFKTELSGLKAQRDRNQESIRQHTTRYRQHNSWKPNPRDHAAVNAYNAEAASLNAQKAQLDAARDRIITSGDALDKREGAVAQRRQELIKRGEALDRKESDLKWARGKLNEQTLKWAENTKRNNARLNELAAQLNTLLTKISQMSSKCSSITGVGTLELDNLNAASEQAARCLQQLWDGASPGTPVPVKPKPGFQVTPNK